jgi:site-specific DNA-methyltransferase (adenine-specific)
VLRDLTERVVIASKGRFDRALSERVRRDKELPSHPTVTRDEFMEATTDVWEIGSESARRVGHPAPFPVELPERLIHIYTYAEDLVLDPFMGSGTTAVAAVRTGRHFVGYDTDAAYVEQAKARVTAERTRTSDSGPVDLVASTTRDIAREALERLGYSDISADVTIAPGMEVSFTAVSPDGARCDVEVAGGFTAVRPGFRRAETLWKVIAKAAVLHETRPDVPFVVLTPSMPAPGPTLTQLLAVVGAGKPIAAIHPLPLSEPLPDH